MGTKATESRQAQFRYFLLFVSTLFLGSLLGCSNGGGGSAAIPSNTPPPLEQIDPEQAELSELTKALPEEYGLTIEEYQLLTKDIDVSDQATLDLLVSVKSETEEEKGEGQENGGAR